MANNVHRLAAAAINMSIRVSSSMAAKMSMKTVMA